MLIADPGQYLAMLIQIYRELNRGETVTLSNLLQRGFFKDEALGFHLMPLAVDVASGVTQARLKTIDQQASTALLGYMLNFPMPFLD